MSKLRIVGSVMAGVIALSAIAAPAAVAGGRPLKAILSGANEVPGPGDPDGSGKAKLRLNQGRQRICYKIVVADIEAPTAAHIHEGDVDTPGPVVVNLAPTFVDGVAKACVTGVDKWLIRDIRKNRADYYVNVHNLEFEAGAIRGQLEKWAPGRKHRHGPFATQAGR